MARRPQETTRLIREVASDVINKQKIWCCVSAAWSIHDLTNKKPNLFLMNEEVVYIGTLVKDCKLLKICATGMRSIAGGCSGTITTVYQTNQFRLQ